MDDRPEVRAFFDVATFTATYLVWDPATRRGAVIDSVRDFDPRSGRTSVASADKVLAAAAEAGVTLDWVLETHAHADHLSAAPYIKTKTGAPIAIGAAIVRVQETFKPIFDLTEMTVDGRQFDRLLQDGERLPLGNLQIEVLATPGHTPACVSYRIGDAVFVGDTLFMPDYGTARCDFPGGDAETLYTSVRRLLSLPAETRMFVGHDYKAPGRETFAWETTVAAQRARNVQIHDGVTKADYIAMRRARDATLAMPVLILPSIQVNIRAGELPAPSANGVRYLKVPLDVL